MTPSIGRIVHYTLSQQDADEINRRRTNSYSIRERISQDQWPIGAQAHFGNEVLSGQTFPAMVVNHWGGGCCNLQVFLDGNDVFWGLSRNEHPQGEPAQGFWQWPAREVM